MFAQKITTSAVSAALSPLLSSLPLWGAQLPGLSLALEPGRVFTKILRVSSEFQRQLSYHIGCRLYSFSQVLSSKVLY